MIPELILIALLVGWLSGGKFWRLADAHIRQGWLILIPIVLYVADWAIRLKMGATSFEWLFPASFVVNRLALLALVALNLRIPGANVILIGMALNFIAIVSNGGVMPVRPDAIGAVYGPEYLAYTKTAPHIQSAIMTATCEVSFLCDIIAARQPFVVMPAVYSVGDIVMSVGIFIAIISLMRTPLPKEKPLHSGYDHE